MTEGLAGRVSRVDPRTGAITTYASGLPPAIIGIGGAADVVFKGGTAYVLVTLVGADVGGSDVVGVYRVDDPTHFTVIADIGAFAQAHPPATDFFIPTGLQYAIENVRDGFLVTDGHHNRIYRVTLDGTVTERITFGNIVPTGLEFRDGKVYVAQAGPVPHLPRYGRILKFRVGSNHVTEVARGVGFSWMWSMAQGISSPCPRASSRPARSRVRPRTRTPAGSSRSPKTGSPGWRGI